MQRQTVAFGLVDRALTLRAWSFVVLSVFVTLFLATLNSAFAQSDQSFTFQGFLKDGNAPADGNYGITFALYDDESGGNLLGSITRTVTVSKGFFTVELDFGNVWNGQPRYLEIIVANTPLTPRVKITRTPYSQFAFEIPDNSVSTAKLQDNSVTDSKIVSVSWNKITDRPNSLPPSGPAGGDLSGNYPNPTVAKIQGRPVSANAPQSKNLLMWDGNAWTPAAWDRSVPSISQAVVAQNTAYNTGISGYIAQTFRPISSGYLRSITVFFDGGGSGAFEWFVYDVEDNRLIARASSGWPSGEFVVTFDANNRPLLIAGRQYRFEMVYRAGSGGGTFRCSNQNPYPDGEIPGRPNEDLWFKVTCDNVAPVAVRDHTTAFLVMSNNGSYHYYDWPAGWYGGLATWDILCQSIRYYGSLVGSSDRHLKRDIQSLNGEEVLDRLMQLNPVSFFWRDPKASQKQHFGFIAQEVEPLFPNLVEQGETLSLNYNGFIPLLTSAVQTQQRQIQEQKALIERQQAEIDQLRAEIQALRALIQQQQKPAAAK